MSKAGTDDARPQRWLVQGEPVVNGTLRASVSNDDAVRELHRIATDVVVLAMSAARAAELKAQFPALDIEPDADLHPFSSNATPMGDP